jgi:hypothetical protein
MIILLEMNNGLEISHGKSGIRTIQRRKHITVRVAGIEYGFLQRRTGGLQQAGNENVNDLSAPDRRK